MFVGTRWRLPLVAALVLVGGALMLPGRAGAQGNQNPLLQSLIAQVQQSIARIQSLLGQVPPGAAFPVQDLARRAGALAAQAQAALLRAQDARAAQTSVIELNQLLPQLVNIERELAGLGDVNRDSAFLTRLIIDAGRELDRARQTLATAPTSRGETLLALSQDALAQARELFRAGQFIQARQFAERSIRLSRDLQHLAVDRDSIRRRIERVLREIDRLADLAPPSPRSTLRLKLAEADRAARAAREAYLADSLGDVATRLVEAEDLIRQARTRARGIHGASTSPERDRADERLKAATLTIKQVATRLGAAPPPLAVRTLTAARRYKERAEGYFTQQLFEASAANAHLAQRLAQRALTVQR